MGLLRKLRDSVKQLFHYVVGKAAKNRDTFLETAAEGEEIVESSTVSVEPWILILLLALSVGLQIWISQFAMLFIGYRFALMALILWAQVKILTVHLRHFSAPVEVPPPPPKAPAIDPV